MDDKRDSSDERTETGMKKAAGAILAAFLTGAGAVSALAAEGYANGILVKSGHDGVDSSERNGGGLRQRACIQ